MSATEPAPVDDFGAKEGSVTALSDVEARPRGERAPWAQPSEQPCEAAAEADMERAIALAAAAAAARLSPDQIARAKKSPGERLQAQVVDVEQLLGICRCVLCVCV